MSVRLPPKDWESSRAGRFAPACVAALSDASSEVIEAAAIASWQTQASDAWKDLVRLTSEPAAGDALRGKAVYALNANVGCGEPGPNSIPGGASPPEDARSRVRAALIARIDDPTCFCRLSAVRGLGSFGDEASRAALRAARSDPDRRVQWRPFRSITSPAARSTAEGTGRTPEAGTASDFPILRDALDDPNPNVRLTAIEAMGRCDPATEAIAELRALLGRSYSSEREREIASLTLAACWKSMLETTTAPARAESIRAAITDLGRSLAQSGSWSLREAAPEILDPQREADRELLDRLLRDEARVAKAAVAAVLRWKASSRPAGRSLSPRWSPN